MRYLLVNQIVCIYTSSSDTPHTNERMNTGLCCPMSSSPAYAKVAGAKNGSDAMHPMKVWVGITLFVAVIIGTAIGITIGVGDMRWAPSSIADTAADTELDLQTLKTDLLAQKMVVQTLVESIRSAIAGQSGTVANFQSIVSGALTLQNITTSTRFTEISVYVAARVAAIEAEIYNTVYTRIQTLNATMIAQGAQIANLTLM